MKSNALRVTLLTALCAVAALATAQERTLSDNVSDEDALIAIIQGDADWAEKQAACRSLRRVGTAKSVPALATLLDDEDLSHMARFALEVMPFPEAGQALRDALKGTSGLQRAGVITSLGARRDAEAVPLLIPMIKDGNIDIARAAAAALGRIATEDAAKALIDAYGTVPPRYQLPIAEALLAAAQTLVAENHGSAAAPIYEKLLADDQPEFVRLGAFRGVVNAQPDQAAGRILEALKGDDVIMRDMAGQLVAETSGADATKAYAAALPALAPEAQLVLLRGLGDRGDAAAHKAVLDALKSNDTSVKIAALQALTKLGQPADVPMLAGLIATGDEVVAGAAKDTLANLRVDGANEAIAAALPKIDPAVRAQLLTLLAGRGADQAVSVATEHLNDDSAEVRAAAVEILGLIGSAADAPAIVSTLVAADNPDVFTAASRALGALAEREADAVTKPLISATDDAEGEAQVAILRALGRAATPTALKAVVDAISDDALKGEAVKILGNWPTPDAAPHLLKLAKSDEGSLKDTGLRGYVRLAGLEESNDKKVEMLTAATKLAATPQEKWIVLSAWGQTPTAKSLDALLPHLKDAEVQNEAAAAIIAVAAELGKDESSKESAAKALQAVVDTVQDDAVKGRAQDALAKLQG